MEDIVGYIIMFAIGLGVLFAYQYRRLRPKEFPLSVQKYPECQLNVMVSKRAGKVEQVIFRTIIYRDMEIHSMKVELISPDRSFNYLSLNRNRQDLAIPSLIKKGQYYDLKFPLGEFVTHIKDQQFKFQSFRFVLENNSNKRFKSHELAFHKNWTIYKPDTGKYN